MQPCCCSQRIRRIWVGLTLVLHISNPSQYFTKRSSKQNSRCCSRQWPASDSMAVQEDLLLPASKSRASEPKGRSLPLPVLLKLLIQNNVVPLCSWFLPPSDAPTSASPGPSSSATELFPFGPCGFSNPAPQTPIQS